MGIRMGLICAGAAALALAPASHAQTLAADRLEATMMIAGNRDQRGIPLNEERLAVTIDGQNATTTMLQVYENQTDGQIEGRYSLRPGSGSHVEGFAYWNGEEKIVGEVFERQAARRVYNNVTTRRRDPGLLEEAGEGAFAFKIFPINPHEKKRVEIRWQRWLDRRDHTIRYRAPSTRRDAEIVIDFAQPVKNLRSSTHKLHVDKNGNGLRVRSDGAIAAGELMLEWDADEPDWTPSAYVHAGSVGDEGWFALSLAAPSVDAATVSAKDVTLVIDRSGSMAADDAIEHAKKAAIDMIRLLSDKDRVNVIAFSDEVDPLFSSPQRATAENRKRAIEFVERLHDGGGTDIALALSTAIKLQAQSAGGGPRVVVFMTDGQSDTSNAIEAAKLDTRDVRLFTLGLGKEVNRPLLSRLAAVKRGTFSYIDSARAIEPEVARLAAHISRPLLVDVSIDVDGPVASRIYPRTLPDLFAEDELLVTGRLRGTGVAKLTIKGKLDGKQVAFTRTVDINKAPPRPWVATLWAQQRVAHLLEEISLGASAPEMVDEVTNLALAYNFVTPYTAFLAIPQSELGQMKGTVEAMRDRKRKLMADNPDVAALDGAKDKKNGAQPGGTYVTRPMASGDIDGKDDEEEDAPRRGRGDVADEDDGEADYAAPAKTTSYTGASADRRHGCAGCATGGGKESLALALIVGALLVRRRRRT